VKRPHEGVREGLVTRLVARLRLFHQPADLGRGLREGAEQDLVEVSAAAPVDAVARGLYGLRDEHGEGPGLVVAEPVQEGLSVVERLLVSPFGGLLAVGLAEVEPVDGRGRPRGGS
jgi:hypothetical protein